MNAALASTGLHHHLVILLASWCSLRRGEILGLRRCDVDEFHRTIRVRRSVTVTSEGKKVTGPPKTKSSVRDVEVPPHVAAQVVDHLQAFVGPEPTAALFSGIDGSPLTPRSVSRIWERPRRTIGRPDVTLHDLRHSGLTWASTVGATTAELMHRAGHKSTVAALRYQHATQDRDRALAERLSALATEADGLVSEASRCRSRKSPRVFRGVVAKRPSARGFRNRRNRL